MTHAELLWIPVTVWAAFAQTLRNVAQRHLSTELGTLVRFLYGLPFALAWLVLVVLCTGEALPVPDSGFALWLVLGGLGRILVTALMLAAMAERNFTLGMAFTFPCAQALQSVALAGWLLARTPQTVVRVMRAWRTSLFAGFIGAAASAGWFTAMAIEPVAHVRTLGLIELLFSSAISRKLFRERLNRTEVAGMLLLVAGLAVVAMGR